MRKVKTWKDNLNDVIRNVFFADDTLLDAMMIHKEERQNIVKFTDKYFIRNPVPDELITTENVRICYSEEQGRSIGSNMIKKYIWFDVFVKNDHLHDCGNDILEFRTDKICQIIKEDLISAKYVCQIDFSYEDDYGLYTKLVGYTRHRILFSYKISF